MLIITENFIFTLPVTALLDGFFTTSRLFCVTFTASLAYCRKIHLSSIKNSRKNQIANLHNHVNTEVDNGKYYLLVGNIV